MAWRDKSIAVDSVAKELMKALRDMELSNSVAWREKWSTSNLSSCDRHIYER